MCEENQRIMQQINQSMTIQRILDNKSKFTRFKDYVLFDFSKICISTLAFAKKSVLHPFFVANSAIYNFAICIL